MDVWNRLDEMDDNDLRLLTLSASEVLIDFGAADQPLPDDLLMISDTESATLAADAMGDRQGDMARLLRDPDASKQATVEILGLLAAEDDLAQLIADRYREHKGEMAVAEVLLLTAPLIILALKLKRVELSGDRKAVDFFPISKEAAQVISSIIGSVLGK